VQFDKNDISVIVKTDKKKGAESKQNKKLVAHATDGSFLSDCTFCARAG